MATAWAPVEDIRQRMDRMYRPQKHIYDLTRKYYLLGRDRLIAELGARPGQSVLDIGCGTGRNLALIGQRYPAARLFGLDAAAADAGGRRRASWSAPPCGRPWPAASPRSSIRERCSAMRRGFDHVTISYCLSMVDDPEAAVRAAVRAPGARAARCTSSTSATWPDCRAGSAERWWLGSPGSTSAIGQR